MGIFGRGGGASTSQSPRSMGARRDVTDRGTAAVYFKDSNFDQTKKEYTMTKMTFGMLAAILLFGVVIFLFQLSINWIVLDLLLFASWVVYFVRSIIAKRKFRELPAKEKMNYWTYELTDEYAQRNVKLNDFKRQLAQSNLIDRSTLVDDVAVDLISVKPLVFEFALRTANAKEKDVVRTVEGWAGKFEAYEGIVNRIGNNAYRATYPMEGRWDILAGKKVSPKDAMSERPEPPSIDWNPFGVKTTTMEEIAVVNTDQHIMLCGASGYGKSATLNAILKVIMEDDSNALIVFFDGKRVESAAVKDRCWQVFDANQANAWMAALSEEFKNRQEYQEQVGKKKFKRAVKAANDPDATPFSDEWPPIVVVIDECAIWITQGAMGDFKFTTAFVNFINTLTRVGRSNGMTLIVAAQEAKSSSIPQGARNNIDQRIAFKQMTSANDEFAIGEFGPSDPRPSEIPAKTPGAGGGIGQCCARTATTNGEVWPVKAYYVDGKEISTVAKKNAYRKKEYRVVARARELYEADAAKGKGTFEPFQ